MTMEPIIISKGTLRTEDLLPAFWRHIPPARQSDIEAEGYADVRAMLDGTLDHATEAATGLLVYLQDVLAEVSPAGMFAGSHEDDPALIGFWPIGDIES